MKELKEIFDLEISKIKSLDGDINYSNIKYAIEDAAGNKFILKIFPDGDELLLAKEESAILEKHGSALSFKVPQNIKTPDGDAFFTHEKGEAKLLNYIEGAFIADVPQTPGLLFSLGQKIAELNMALQNAESNLLSSRRLFWDLQYAYLNYSKIGFIREPARRKLVSYYFDCYQHFVFPHQHALRHSIIHGDLNDYNILVKDGEIEGLLDFGDATYAPMVNDIAIAMAYMMLGKKDPFEEIIPLLKGYQSVNPLMRKEIELLPDLITTRLCISLCNSAEKKNLGQDNEYVLISEKPAWELLEKWIKTNPIKIKNAFLAAAGFQVEYRGKTKDQLLIARKVIAGKSLGLSYASPILMTSAAFQYMYDEAGNTYLDAYNNIAHIGHSHPAISAAISRQIRILNTNTRYLYEQFAEYGNKLLRYFPDKLSKIFFVNSGSEANDLAIRMARTFTRRNKVAVLEHGYHGNTTLGIEISSYKFDGKGGKGISPEILKLPLPNTFRGKFDNGADYTLDAVRKLEGAIDNLPCAFIAEPISGCGGQVPLAAGYLKGLYTYLNANGVLTISDEVQTGFGRLGRWFWGFEMHGVVPDIVVVGKPMGNGHPIAAVITTEEVSESFANGMEFFSSFGGNPVSCAAASAVLDVIEEESLQANAKETGDYFKARLLARMAKFACVANVRGHGLFLGIEFLTKEGNPDKELANTVKNKLKDNFILTGTDGPNDNVIKIKPPLCFNMRNADEFIYKFEKILVENEG